MSNGTNGTQPIFDPVSVDIFRVFVYQVVTVVYLTVGLSGNVILLLAFYKQSKTEQAYGYQVVFTVSKTLEIFSYGTFLIAAVWLDSSDPSMWFVSNKVLMFLFKFLGITGHLTLINFSLLLACAMAADRVLAIAKPAVHRSINHRRHQLVATVCCFCIGLLGNGVYLRHFEIFPDGDRYRVLINQDLNHSIVGVLFFHVRLWIRFLGLGTLVGLDVVMVMIFRKHNRKGASMASDQEQRRKSAEKALLWINIYQACMMILNQVPHVTWVTLYYIFPELDTSYGMIIGPACDAMLMITDTVDFFIVIGINKKMRRMVINAAPPCLRPIGATGTAAVTPVVPAGGAQSSPSGKNGQSLTVSGQATRAGKNG